ncbi:MAG: hypothetical protein JXB23_01200 [Candidatus Aminicenantes bacterium]|nr:hypothetical protein [Candidatus Aminicenantes bacterium]
MKNKFKYIGILIALIVVVMAILLVLTHKRDVFEGEASEKKTKPAGVEKESKTEVKMPRIILDMDVNGRKKIELVRGTPLFLTVSLRNAGAQRSARVRNLIKHYSEKEYSQLEKDTQEKILNFLEEELEETPDKTVVLRSGTHDAAKWISFQILSDGEYQLLPWNVEILASPHGREISLDGKIIALFEYGLSPEALIDIPPGDYTLRAQLIPGLASEIKERLESEVADIRIIEEEKASKKMLQERILLCSRYYLKKGDIAEAERFARQLRISHPRYVPGLMLAGEIYEKMGKDMEAYISYQEALNVLAEKKEAEPPPLLIEKINKFLFAPQKKTQDVSY